MNYIMHYSEGFCFNFCFSFSLYLTWTIFIICPVFSCFRLYYFHSVRLCVSLPSCMFSLLLFSLFQFVSISQPCFSLSLSLSLSLSASLTLFLSLRYSQCHSVSIFQHFSLFAKLISKKRILFFLLNKLACRRAYFIINYTKNEETMNHVLGINKYKSLHQNLTTSSKI